MGKVIFLNKQSEVYHKEKNIEIVNPPALKLVVNRPKPKRAKKAKRETMGQRIYNHLQNNPPDDAS